MNNINEYWAKVCEKIEPEMVKISYDTWISTLIPISIDEQNIYLKAQSSFHKQTVEIKYTKLIRDALKNLTNKDYNINIIQDECNDEFDSDKLNVKILNSGINPNYTFETFVCTTKNRFAHAASLAVVEDLGKKYNPLFLYGNVGIEKTHLMHAIGNFAIIQNDNVKVVYTTPEKFSNELVHAIINNATDDFYIKYRNIDLLLMDNFQLFSTNQSLQKEFFCIFNYLYENKKQIVISSDKPPKDIASLDEKTKSILESGLVINVQERTLVANSISLL